MTAQGEQQYSARGTAEGNGMVAVPAREREARAAAEEGMGEARLLPISTPLETKREEEATRQRRCMRGVTWGAAPR